MSNATKDKLPALNSKGLRQSLYILQVTWIDKLPALNSKGLRPGGFGGGFGGGDKLPALNSKGLRRFGRSFSDNSRTNYLP